jgi:hypothetical protein
MDNTYNFPFSSKFIIGSDAGYWLPILTGRNTVTIPMSFTIERFSSTSRIDQLVNLHELNGHLTSSSAMSLLSESGVSYVYIGQNGGPIDVDELKVSPRFQLEYHQGNIYIFKFLTPDNR